MDLFSTKKQSFYKKKFVGLTYTNQKIQDKEFENCIFEKCRAKFSLPEATALLKSLDIELDD